MTIDAYLQAMKERFVTDPIVTRFPVPCGCAALLVWWVYGNEPF